MWRIPNQPQYDPKSGDSFYDQLRASLRSQGIEAEYGMHHGGSAARFSMRPEGAPYWLDLNIAPGPEGDWGQTLFLPTTGRGGNLLGPSGWMDQNKQLNIYSAPEALGNIVKSAYSRNESNAENITEHFWGASQEMNPQYQTVGGFTYIGGEHFESGAREFASRLKIGHDPDLYVNKVLDQLGVVQSNLATSSDPTTAAKYGPLAKYAPTSAQGGVITMQHLLHGTAGDPLYAMGSSVDKVIKGLSTLGIAGFGQRSHMYPLTYTREGIGKADAHDITKLQRDAGIRNLNAIFPDESSARESVVIPRMLHVPETPTPGAGMTYRNPLAGLYGFGYESRVDQRKLQFENLGELARTKFEFGIFEQDKEGAWQKQRELVGATVGANQTVTWGLITQGDKTTPLEYTSPGRESYFTEQPSLVVPRIMNKSLDKAISAGGYQDAHNITDLSNKGDLRGQQLLKDIRAGFPGTVDPRGLYNVEIDAPITIEGGAKTSGSLKMSFSQATSPAGEGEYRPTVNIGGIDVQPEGVATNIKSLSGVMGRMFSALPKPLQKQFAMDVMGEKGGLLSLGKEKANFEQLADEWSQAIGKKTHVPEFLHQMTQNFISAAREDPRHFMETYEMGVTPEGKNLQIPFGYVSDWEKQDFRRAMESSIRLEQPDATDAEVDRQFNRTYQFDRYKDTDYHEMSFSSPALYGPMAFEPATEFLGKQPSFTTEEIASLSYNYPALSKQMGLTPREMGKAGEVAESWRAMGELQMMRKSNQGQGVLPDESIATSISKDQARAVAERAGELAEGKPTAESYAAAMDELMPDAGRILMGAGKVPIPSPGTMATTASSNIGVDTVARPFQPGARNYARMWSEAMITGSPGQGVHSFYEELERLETSEDSALHRHRAREVLSGKIGGTSGRYGAMLGLPIERGGPTAIMQARRLQAGGVSRRVINQMNRGDPTLGVLQRSPNTARSAMNRMLINTPLGAEAQSGMKYGQIPDRTPEGTPTDGNPLLGGAAFHTNPIGIRQHTGDFDYDQAVMGFLKETLPTTLKGQMDNPLAFEELTMPKSYPELREIQDRVLRSQAWHEGGIPAARFDETIDAATKQRAVAQGGSDFLSGKRDYVEPTAAELFQKGRGDIIAEQGMGSSYNLRRWGEAASAVLGFGEQSQGAGHSARYPTYQMYVDKSLQGTPLEKQVSAARWSRKGDNAPVLMGAPLDTTSGIGGQMWNLGGTNLDKEGLTGFKTQLFESVMASRKALHPLDQAFMMSQSEEEFNTMRERIEADVSPKEAIWDVVDRDDYDPRKSVLGRIMTTRATAKLHGVQGFRKSTQSVKGERGFDEKREVLDSMRRYSGVSITGDPSHAAITASQWMKIPEIEMTHGAYQQRDPKKGLPTLEASVGLASLRTDAPLVLEAASRFGGAKFKGIMRDYGVVNAMDEIIQERQGRDQGAAGAGAEQRRNRGEDPNYGTPGGGDGDDGDDGGGTPIFPAAQPDDEGGGQGGGFDYDRLNEMMGYHMGNQKITTTFSGVKSRIGQNRKLLSGLTQANRELKYAKEFQRQIEGQLDFLEIPRGPITDRIVEASGRDAGLEMMTETATAMLGGARGRRVGRAGRALEAAQIAIDKGEATQGVRDEFESLQRRGAVDAFSTTGGLQGLDESSFATGKKNVGALDLERYAEGFERLHKHVEKSAEKLEGFQEKLEGVKDPVQRGRGERATLAGRGLQEMLAPAYARVTSALEGDDKQELLSAMGDYDQIAGGILSSVGAAGKAVEGRASKFGRGFRRAFGGFGLMYMRSMIGFGTSQWQKGYQEWDQYAQASTSGAMQMFGEGEISPFEGRELAYQRASLRSGGGVWGAIRQLSGQGGMQDVMGSVGTGVGLAGVATHLAQSFGMSSFLGLTGNAALGAVAGVAGGVGLVGGLALSQYAYQQNPDDTLMQAVASKQSGNELAAWAKGVGLRKTGDREVLERMQTGAPSWRQQEATLNYQVQQALEGGEFGFGGLRPDEILQVSQTAGMVEDTPLDVLDPKLAQSLLARDLAGKWGMGAERLAAIGSSIQAGLPTEQVGGLLYSLQNSGAVGLPQDTLQLVEQAKGMSPTMLQEISQGGNLLGRMPGRQRFVEANIAGAASPYGGMYESELVAGLGRIEGGANEDLWMQTQGVWAQADALGAEADMPDYRDFDRGEYWTQADRYAQVQENIVGTQATKVFSSVQALGMDKGIADNMRTFANQGLSQGRMVEGLLQMDQYKINQMAMGGAGGIFQDLANMDINAAGDLTGLAWGTTSLARGGTSSAAMGQQILGDLAGTEAGRAAVAGGTRGLKWLQFQQGYEQQSAQLGIQAQRLALQEEYQPQFWAIEDKQTALNRRRQEWGFEYQEQMFDVQGQQFQENMAFQRQQQLRGRMWTQQDWGYQDQMRNMQWGWQQEDFQENVRFMTGRQRKQAERQMERQTIVHGMEGDRIDTQRDRQRQLWADEDMRFEMTLRHHQEVREIQEENFKKQVEFYEEGKKLQDESTKLHREYWEKNMELNKQALGVSEEQLKKNKEIQEVMMKINDAQADQNGQWQLAQATAAETVETLIDGFNHFITEFPDAIEKLLDGDLSGMSAWENTFVSSGGATNQLPGDTTIIVQIGDETFGEYIVGKLDNALNVAV